MNQKSHLSNEKWPEDWDLSHARNRSGGIWTHDPYYPKVVRYQAAPRPGLGKLSQGIALPAGRSNPFWRQSSAQPP